MDEPNQPGDNCNNLETDPLDYSGIHNLLLEITFNNEVEPAVLEKIFDELVMQLQNLNVDKLNALVIESWKRSQYS